MRFTAFLAHKCPRLKVIPKKVNLDVVVARTVSEPFEKACGRKISIPEWCQKTPEPVTALARTPARSDEHLRAISAAETHSYDSMIPCTA